MFGNILKLYFNRCKSTFSLSVSNNVCKISLHFYFISVKDKLVVY